MINGKMVNGSRFYRALESVSIASALSSALTIYPCQIWFHQRWQSKLQLPTTRKKEWRPTTADSLMCCVIGWDRHFIRGMLLLISHLHLTMNVLYERQSTPMSSHGLNSWPDLEPTNLEADLTQNRPIWRLLGSNSAVYP